MVVFVLRVSGRYGEQGRGEKNFCRKKISHTGTYTYVYYIYLYVVAPRVKVCEDPTNPYLGA